MILFNSRVIKKIDPKVKDVLLLLGVGTFLAASLIMPGLPAVLKPLKDIQKKKAEKEWKRFNLWRLRQVVKRLEEQKVIEIEGDIVKITNKGKKRLLRYRLEEMQLNKKFDGKWRLIIYDVSNFKKQQRDLFRSMLKRLNTYRLQESVCLTPFACEDEIEYLRQMFSISEEVQVLRVTGIENEQVYRDYFGV